MGETMQESNLAVNQGIDREGKYLTFSLGSEEYGRNTTTHKVAPVPDRNCSGVLAKLCWQPAQQK